MISFEQLDSQGRSPLCLQAIEMLAREIGPVPGQKQPVTQEHVAAELQTANLFGHIYYGLLDTSELAAAACVAHQHKDPGDIEPKTATVIWQLAVHPEQRRRGVARTLVKHIAHAAMKHGDAEIALMPLKGMERIFARLGFWFEEENVMVSTPDLVLDM